MYGTVTLPLLPTSPMGRIHNTLYSSHLTNGPHKVEYCITLNWKDLIGKHSSLFGPLKSYYGECMTSRRMNCPKRFHEKIFYLSCIFL